MPVTPASPAPYAPPSAVLGIVGRHRSRGLPSPIDADVLGRAGISQSLVPRTLQALQALDLIDADGRPTANFENLRLAPENEYKNALAQWLSGAYADVLTFIDPATATEVQVRDAFRTYNPVGQQPRMVTLFITLFAEAGIVPQKEPKAAQSRPRERRAAPPKPERKGGLMFVKTALGNATVGNVQVSMHPALAGLLSSIPQSGKNWTKAQRDLFLNAFGNALDFVVPIGEPPESGDDELAA